MEAINLFPESQFLRIKRKTKLDHQSHHHRGSFHHPDREVDLGVRNEDCVFHYQTAISLEPVMTNINTYSVKSMTL